STVTLTPADGVNNIVTLRAGVDRNLNGTLESSEEMKTVEVMVIQLDSITVSDKAHPAQSAANPTATQLYVAEPISGPMSGKVQINIDATGSPDTLEAGAHVKWQVVGNGVGNAHWADGTTGAIGAVHDFYHGNPWVDLIPNASGNREFT